MAPVLLVAALGLLYLPGVAWRFGRRLHPAEWSWLSLLILVIGALMLETAFVLYALPTTLRSIGVHHLADMCERANGAVLPGGAVLAWPAAVMALLLPARFVLAAYRARRVQTATQIEPCLGQHRPVAGYDLVVLPTESVVAFSVRGRTSQVVISRGLIDTLKPDEVDAVVRHEAAHLDHRHQWLLLLARSLEESLPLGRFIRRSTRAVRTGLERWADESAAGHGGASRAVLRRALVGVCEALAVPPGVPAFSALDTIAERLEALSAAPPRPSLRSRSAAYAPPVLIAAIVIGAIVVWRHEILHVLALIRHHCA